MRTTHHPEFERYAGTAAAPMRPITAPPTTDRQYGPNPYSDHPFPGLRQNAAPETKPWHTMSYVGFILSFFVGVAGVVLGIISLVQHSKNPSRWRGKGLAIASIAVGGGWILIWFSMMAGASSTGAY